MSLLAVKFAIELKFKQITAKFTEYIGHNAFAFIFFALIAGIDFLLVEVRKNLPVVWFPFVFNLVPLAFLIITWINPVRMQWIKKASGSINPEVNATVRSKSQASGELTSHVFM